MHILTFDIEEWFHINNSDWIGVEKWPNLEKRIVPNTNIILSFLKRHKIKASFFILGWIAEQYPDLVLQIDKDGHDIGFHSYYHRIPQNQSPNEFENDLKKGLDILENILQKKVRFYRAPNFSLKNKWMLDCLINNGITISSSIKNPIHNDGTALPNKPFIFTKNNQTLIELPLVTWNLLFNKFAYSGSGYFRLLPYIFIKSMLQNQDYQMLYFHPRDFDISIPIPKELGFARNILNTIGTSSTLPKLEKLSKHFSFISISQAIEMLDENKLQKVDY